MKLIDCIVCDDIRQEVGGKVTLVGVYDDRIMLNIPKPEAMRWPVQLKLGFFIRLVNDGTCEDMDGLDLQVHCNEKIICRLSGPLKIPPKSGLINLFFVNSGVRIPAEGDLRITLLFKKGQQVVREIRPGLTMRIGVTVPGGAQASTPPPQVTRH